MIRTHLQRARRITTLALFAVVAVGLGCNSFYFPRPQRGELVDSWETSNKSFKVRVSQYSEKGRAPAGAYYVFESGTVGSTEYQEIMTFRNDDAVPIPREQVRLQTESFGYLFMVYKFAVTSDSGVTWCIWDAAKEIPDWRNNRAAIKEIQIAGDGNGIMTLLPFTY